MKRKANGDGMWTPNHFTYIHETKGAREYITLNDTIQPEAKPADSKPKQSQMHNQDKKNKPKDVPNESQHAQAESVQSEEPKQLWTWYTDKNNSVVMIPYEETSSEAPKNRSPLQKIKQAWNWVKSSKEEAFEDEDSDIGSKDFLLFQNAFRHIEARHSVAMKKIPPGLHKCCDFVIKNPNLERYAKGKDFKHPRCDAGAFQRPNSKCKVWESLDNSKFKERTDLAFDVKPRVITKNGVPISPTEAEKFYVSKQVWGRLKRDPRFKKKITYVLETPDKHEHLKNM